MLHSSEHWFLTLSRCPARWSNIMKDKGILMTYTKFLRLAPPIGFSTMVVSMFILWFEFAVFDSV